MEVFFEQSVWKQALIATIIISVIPNVLLVFLPEEVFKQESAQNSKKNGKRSSLRYGKMFVMFAVAGLLGDVFLHAIPHILHPHHDHQPVSVYHHVTNAQNDHMKHNSHVHDHHHDHKQSYQLLTNNMDREGCECEMGATGAIECSCSNNDSNSNHEHEHSSTSIEHHDHHHHGEHEHERDKEYSHNQHNHHDHHHHHHHHHGHHSEHECHHDHSDNDHDHQNKHASKDDSHEHSHSHSHEAKHHHMEEKNNIVHHDSHDHGTHDHHSHESHDHDHSHDSFHGQEQGHVHSQHDHAHDHSHGHSHGLSSKEVWAPLLILTGFLVFYLADKIALQMFSDDSSHSHGHGHNHEHNHLLVSGWLNLVADAMHNFTDGITLGVACTAGSGLATATFLSVLIHELPHELSDFTILVRSGMSKWAAIQLQFVTAIAALVGAVVGVYLAEDNQLLQDVVGSLTAGGFVYIATVSLIPEALKQEEVDGSSKESVLQVIGEALFFAAGVFLMVLVGFLEAH